jgi:hypothetical protein
LEERRTSFRAQGLHNWKTNRNLRDLHIGAPDLQFRGGLLLKRNSWTSRLVGGLVLGPRVHTSGNL